MYFHPHLAFSQNKNWGMKSDNIPKTHDIYVQRQVLEGIHFNGTQQLQNLYIII